MIFSQIENDLKGGNSVAFYHVRRDACLTELLQRYYPQ